jgi:predicted flap endonuclease-1-like 5' DNA nuclease
LRLTENFAGNGAFVESVIIGPNLLTASIVLGAAAVGAIGAWLPLRQACARRLKQMELSWLARLKDSDELIEQLKGEVGSLNESLETERAEIQKLQNASTLVRDQYNAAREKFVVMQNEIDLLEQQREQLKYNISEFENAVDAGKERIAELKAEIKNLQNIHKTKLASEAEERRSLQRKLDDARSEQQSLTNLLTAARFEHEATTKMLEKAQAKHSDFAEYDDKIDELETEIVKLQHELTLARQETELVRRDVGEVDELKEQNNHLASCLASMDKSRKQYEEDARRYRAQYEKSEKESDTLRFMLSDIEKHWETYHGDDDDPEEEEEKKLLAPGFLREPDGDIDDLTKIVGVGKVFEKTLHDLGVYHYRQIAAFGEKEIEQVNRALKEFNGRMENDDWIGQATALQFKKYGKL